jgi:hypothetical protein
MDLSMVKAQYVIEMESVIMKEIGITIKLKERVF